MDFGLKYRPDWTFDDLRVSSLSFLEYENCETFGRGCLSVLPCSCWACCAESCWFPPCVWPTPQLPPLDDRKRQAVDLRLKSLEEPCLLRLQCRPIPREWWKSPRASTSWKTRTNWRFFSTSKCDGCLTFTCSDLLFPTGVADSCPPITWCCWSCCCPAVTATCPWGCWALPLGMMQGLEVEPAAPRLGFWRFEFPARSCCCELAEVGGAEEGWCWCWWCGSWPEVKSAWKKWRKEGSFSCVCIQRSN